MNCSDIPGFKEKLAYGCGDFASVLYWATIGNWLLYFYTDVFGISAYAAGMMILVARLWDGVNDPLMGIIADRTETRFGKFRPWLLWMAVPMGVIAVLTFTVPDFGPTGKLVYACCTYLLFMMIYTAINIPYSSLLGVITADTTARTSVAFYKYIFALTSSGLVSLLGLPLAQDIFGTRLATRLLGHPSEAFGWQILMLVFSIVAVVFFVLSFIGTRERVRPMSQKAGSIRADLCDLLTNRHWFVLLGVSLLMILFIAIRMSVTTHYFKYVTGDQTISIMGQEYAVGFVSLTSAFLVMSGWMGVLGILCTRKLATTLDKRHAFMLFMSISVVCTAALYVTPPDALKIIFALQIVGSFAGGPLSPLLWAMYADTADYGEWKNGRRATGLVFSASTMSQKMGWAVGSFVAGTLLGAVGFVPNVDATEEVKYGLLLLMSLIPAGAGAIGLGLMTLYRLNRRQMAVIEIELKQRRNATAALDAAQ